MKVLLIQENGRHEANKNFRECFCLQRAFISSGWNADVWGLGHNNYNIPPNYDDYDWIINLENYDETNWVPDLSHTTKPKKFLWSVDAHCRGEKIYEHTFLRGKYDYLLHSTKDYVKQSHHIWFPNAFDDTLLFKMNKPKVHTLGFCGNYVNRKPILEWLQKEHNLHLDIFVIGEAMVEAVNSYKCQFNLNIANDINYRSFETIGCGTLLLTNYNPQYNELGFIDGDNCLMYSTEQDLIDKINFVNTGDVSELALRGHALSQRHTYKERVQYLVNLCK